MFRTHQLIEIGLYDEEFLQARRTRIKKEI